MEEKNKHCVSESGCDSKCGCKIGVVIVGIMIITLGMFFIVFWWADAVKMIKGFFGLGLFLLGVGIIAISKR